MTKKKKHNNEKKQQQQRALGRDRPMAEANAHRLRTLDLDPLDPRGGIESELDAVGPGSVHHAPLRRTSSCDQSSSMRTGWTAPGSRS
jgi:hypothetical protein